MSSVGTRASPGLTAALCLCVRQAGVHLCLAHRTVTAEVERLRERLYPWAARLLCGRTGETGGMAAAADSGATAQSQNGGGRDARGQERDSPARGQNGESKSPTEEPNGAANETENTSSDSRSTPAAGQENGHGGSRDWRWLLGEIRSAWRTDGAEITASLQQDLQEVAYRTIPTSPKQVRPLTGPPGSADTAPLSGAAVRTAGWHLGRRS